MLRKNIGEEAGIKIVEDVELTFLKIARTMSRV